MISSTSVLCTRNMLEVDTKHNNQQRVEFKVSWIHVLLISKKIPWIQKKLLWNVVYAHSQVCSSSKINNFECPRL